ncbi:receptor-like protein 44 [Physcomitrium patens]|uniref:Leucine-rich repeat-containing N-terminal plant-type domain-containing protein n=1 Tax=Physcomitrium patens TaxID=3218 RepID=A9TD74_PHYPA|nr:leucine-rich repeat protein 1-like [Physcomitrium patens]XP_024379912.1 leucine-rich repeat protein 1-like [Physcomitrium patens]PNR50776.1 hypothetical protein PHYPA_009962 [Physcomitrium patens]|eukprot:XP_024379911.1 leucine-rich repeat protein 1-like [Physcomitrella patens]
MKFTRGSDTGLWLLTTSVSYLALFSILVSIPELALAQPNEDDIACLHGFQSMAKSSDPALFNNWTDTAFPCNTTQDGQRATFVGITCSSSRVVSLFLSDKGLTGMISPNLSLCRNLGILDLSQNSLTGTLPSELGMLSYLMTLNVSHNQISGPIPPEIANCSYLHELDLEHNRFSGEVSTALATLQKLQILDVSHNDLVGPIPTGLSNTSDGRPRFNASSFEGNPRLYGFPLPYPKSRTLSILAIVGIGLGSGFLSLIVSFTAVCVWLRVTEQRLAAEEGKISQLVPEYD